MSIINLPISMESEALAALKADMDSLITQTITSMQAWKNKEGVISVKLNIKLSEDMADDGRGGTRIVTVPRFEHKVSAVLQAKAERKGSTTGEYELVWDEDTCRYVMVRKADNQTSMFDEEDQNQGFDYKVFGGHLEASGEVTDTEDGDDDLSFEDDDLDDEQEEDGPLSSEDDETE